MRCPTACSYRCATVLFFAGMAGLIMLLAGGSNAKGETQTPIPLVQYTRVKAEDVTLKRELSGRTSAFIVSEVRPQVSGIIQKRLFREGADVTSGQILYQIDPATNQAAYNKAKAALMEAEAEVVAIRLLKQRYAKLVTQSAVSRQEDDNATSDLGRPEAKVASAQAELETAAINLDYTRVRAPVSGRIGRSSVTPGTLVTQNQSAPLATVQQLDPMYVDVTQSTVELLRLNHALGSGELMSGPEETPLTLILENGHIYREREKQTAGKAVRKRRNGRDADTHEAPPVLGRLAFSDITVDQNTGAVSLRAIFPNPDSVLMPGMYVRAVFQEGIKEQAILVPQKAVSAWA